MSVASRRSIANTRERPLAKTTAAVGNAAVHGQIFTIETQQRVQLVDLTDRVIALVRETGIREGFASLCSTHTTCSVLINEAQTALLADIGRFLEHIVRRDGDWLHNDPAHSDCDRQNADAHLRALVLGHGVTLQVSGGEIVLGQWQRILVAELDGPRQRTLRLSVFGLAGDGLAAARPRS